jgi:hypothetical protein
MYDEEDPTANISDSILKVYYHIIMTAAKLVKSLDRWCNVSTCMIEKVKGNPHIDKFRVIHLYEADYNLILKIVWARKTVWSAHNKGRLHEGQAGSHPGQIAIDVVLNKEMKNTTPNLQEQYLERLITMPKFFDRILCSLAMMVSRYNGIPINLCCVQADTLQKSLNYIQH